MLIHILFFITGLIIGAYLILIGDYLADNPTYGALAKAYPLPKPKEPEKCL